MAKLRVRKARVPSQPVVNSEENQISSGLIDVFATAPSTSSAYVPDSIDRSYSRPPMSSHRDDYRNMQSGLVHPVLGVRAMLT